MTAFEHVAARGPGSTLLLLCDHASAALPEGYGRLGLDPALFQTHIAYDIGAESVTRQVAELLGAPAICTRFSRLLIDPNRGLDDPTLIMRISDGAVVPGNACLSTANWKGISSMPLSCENRVSSQVLSMSQM